MKIHHRILNGLFFMGFALLAFGCPTFVFLILCWFLNPYVCLITLFFTAFFLVGFFFEREIKFLSHKFHPKT